MRTLRQFLLGLSALLAVALVAILAGTISRPSQAQSTFAPFQCNSSAPISQIASAQLITANNSSMFTYICSIEYATGGTAQTGSLVEGTGTTCGTNTAALMGGTTAAAGGPISSSPVQIGGGVGYILKTATAGDNVCLLQSSTARTGGYVTYAQEPY